jgi:GAF domain-containing protein
MGSGNLLDETLRQIASVMGSDTSAILLLDEEGRYLTVHAALGFGREIEHAVPIPFGEGVAGRVAATGKPIVIHDLSEVELAQGRLSRSPSPPGTRAAVALENALLYLAGGAAAAAPPVDAYGPSSTYVVRLRVK